MNNQFLDKANLLINEGKSQDDVLKMLSANCSITDAMIVVRSAYKVSLQDAKEIVSASPYWHEDKFPNEVLHELLEMNVLNKTENSIHVIFPYKYSDMWVFDDESVGLLQEPFVEGADTMIDKIVESTPRAKAGFALFFSSDEFPNVDFTLEWRRADGSGNWYYSKAFDMEGWLCPALLKYFTEPPKHLYIKIKPKG